MNKKTIAVVFLLTLVILAGAPGSFARPEYLASLSATYGDGSCGTCHVRVSGGGPLNSYGTLFQKQSTHAADPGAALKVIGQPTTATETPATTPGTPATPGFGFVAALVGLFACTLRRHNR